MSGEKDIVRLIKGMKPVLNPGEYVFCTVTDTSRVSQDEVIGSFKEREGTTLILAKEKADELGLTYNYVAAWITLEIHSALDAVGLTAAFSAALAQTKISCNVVAGYYHDHIFVDYAVKDKALSVLKSLAKEAG